MKIERTGVHSVKDFGSVAIYLIGCGGTGSHLAFHIASLVRDLQAMHIHASLTLIDHDTVEEKNIGRQRFFSAEIGGSKVEALASRISLWLGLDHIYAIPTSVPDAWSILDKPMNSTAELSVFVSCVDDSLNRRTHTTARQDVHEFMSNRMRWANLSNYWIDCGNDNDSGNVYIGNGLALNGFGGMVSSIPFPTLQNPILLEYEEPLVPLDNCALATERGEQSLVINSLVAANAYTILHALLIDQQLECMAVSVACNPSIAQPTLLPYITDETETADGTDSEENL